MDGALVGNTVDGYAGAKVGDKEKYAWVSVSYTRFHPAELRTALGRICWVMSLKVFGSGIPFRLW